MKIFSSVKTRNFSFDRRLTTVSGLIFLLGGILLWKLFFLQVLSGAKFRADADKQHNIIRILPAERGRILYAGREESDYYPLAANRAFNHLYAVPRDIADVDEAVDKLLPLVEQYKLPEETLRARLGKRDDVYEPLLRKLSDEELQPFRDLNLVGLAWEKENLRFYPEAELGAQLIGFVGQSGNDSSVVGKYGLEAAFDKELAGQDGRVEGDIDIRGRLIQTGEQKRIEPRAGVDLILAIDRVIENYACRRLAEKVEKLGATGGQVIVANPRTGAILAMCSSPSFDPNNYNQVKDIAVFLNPSVSGPYEPGSIFKAITMAAAIDAGKVTPATVYKDTGAVKFGGFIIKNFDNKAHGEPSMIEVLKQSLNTGAIFAAQQLGNAQFLEYAQKFGFGKPTGVTLPKEAAGNLKSLFEGRDLNFATASFGQGITATPLQMLMAYAAIANGGKLLRPYAVAAISENGKITSRQQPEIAGQPISLRTATILSGMLTAVVREGHAKRAGVPGYFIAAKTGTAEVPEAGGYGKSTIHSVVGFGPVRKPAFVMIAKIDHPKAGRFAESTAVPLFGDIAKFILQYYEIPPDENI